MDYEKAFTDLEQSKKLAEILPLESADMRYASFGDIHPWVWDEEVKLLEKGSIPCWSLAALLKILNDTAYSIDEDASIDLGTYKTSAWSLCLTNTGVGGLIEEPNPIDACYEMILNLKEQKLL